MKTKSTLKEKNANDFLTHTIKNKGITLIALVITIIIMLILVGITINLVIGENGIIKRAQEAGKNYLVSANKEELELAHMNNQIDEIVGNSRDNNTNNNILLLKPNTWVVGTEYDFGDNVYGQRFVGNIDDNDIELTVGNYIISCGGYVTLSGDPNKYFIPYIDFDGYFARLYIRSDGKIYLNTAIFDDSYDVFVIYTKPINN